MDDQIMYRALRHDIYSAKQPPSCSWEEKCTNPYSKLLYAYPHMGCTLGTLSSAYLNYANPSFCTDIDILPPRHSWNLHIQCA